MRELFQASEAFSEELRRVRFEEGSEDQAALQLQRLLDSFTSHLDQFLRFQTPEHGRQLLMIASAFAAFYSAFVAVCEDLSSVLEPDVDRGGRRPSYCSQW